ncbi:hypothetical protein [Methylovorus sp. MP688]|uniref:hypothetical protein n=1 Tax=Methylovorus sp. (strain MP688) TaxID=887061 RepID=UPI00059D2030|nr:hypothetical protein [Methylovorus sp. MP688]
MVTEFAPEGYEPTLDRIVSAFGKAPHFVIGGRSFTLNEIFGDILYGVEGVKAKTKVPEKLEIIEQVIAKLHEARAALEANEERAGIMALADAKELFRSIRLAGRK